MENSSSAFDRYFVNRMFALIPECPPSCAVLFEIVMGATRLGHLCVSLRNPPAELLSTYNTLDLPARLQEAASALSSHPLLHKFLIVDNEHVYFAKHWALQKRIEKNLRRLATDTSQQAPTTGTVFAQLRPQQQEAVRQILGRRLSLLTGGPGTGKTFAAAAIVQAHLLAGILPRRIVLTAPTGRAAQHLKENTTRYLEVPQPLRTCTLHLLQKEEGLHVCADVVVVDESSMIDASILDWLLASLPTGCTLVLMGDPHQLPPVGLGSIFADLVRLDLAYMGVCKAHLTVSHRVTNPHLRDLAESILAGTAEKWPLWELPMQFYQEEAFYTVLWNTVREKYPIVAKKDEMLATLTTFRLLAALNKGPFGATAINRIFAFYSWQQATTLWVAPILITVNREEFCNGEQGILVREVREGALPSSPCGPHDYAVFPTKERTFPASALPAWEYAFCSTIHKSQGSEYTEVVVVIPPGSDQFGRELLYTATTRAKETLYFVADRQTLAKMQTRATCKISGIECVSGRG